MSTKRLPLPPPACTMQDVARAAGVHVSTVSRALRRIAGVSTVVRDRVRRTAEEMGYRPNPLVSALIRSRRDPHRSKYHATLGYLMPAWPGDPQAYRQDYHGMMEGARTAAAGLGYQLEHFPLAAGARAAQRLNAILEARNIAGLVLPPLHSAADEVGVDWSALPLVAIGFSQRIPVPRVTHDHGRSVRMVIERLVAAGRRRLGLVLPRRVSDKVEGRWLASFLLERKARRGRLIEPLLLEAENGADAFRRWVRHHHPDAIIGLPHLTPMADWLEGLPSLPRPVSLITLDARPFGVDYTGINQDDAAIGAVAVEHLVNRIERRGTSAHWNGTLTTMVAGRWHEGSTL